MSPARLNTYSASRATTGSERSCSPFIYGSPAANSSTHFDEHSVRVVLRLPDGWYADPTEHHKMTAPQARNIARGGKALYGAPLGILMLEARFPRIPGDMGNAETWPFPVLYRVVRGATPERVVLA